MTETPISHAERRNYQSRAVTIGAVLDMLLSGGVPASQHGIHQSVTERICKRLALRGLVRVSGTGWEPSPPLLCPAFLVLVPQF